MISVGPNRSWVEEFPSRSKIHRLWCPLLAGNRLFGSSQSRRHISCNNGLRFAPEAVTPRSC